MSNESALDRVNNDPNSLEHAFIELMQFVKLSMHETTAKLVQDASKEIAREVQIEYDDFFIEMFNVVSAKLTDIPNFLAKYLPEKEWISISTRWDEEKQKWLGMPAGRNWHYKGLSNAGTMALGLNIAKRHGRFQKDRGLRRLTGRKGPRQRSDKKVNVPPFAKYISSLQAVGTTEKFFGPVTLQYEFQAPDIGHTFTPTMGWAKVGGDYVPNAITRIQHRNRGQFSKFPTQLQITANLEAFGVLKGVKDLEWFLVDYIIKRIDPGHEKQWVKINGTRGPSKMAGKLTKSGKERKSDRYKYSHGREVKPIIQPLIRYFIQSALPAAMKRGNIQG